MIGYVTIGTTDMSKAKAFYSALPEPLGGKVIMEMNRIAFIGSGMDKPMLAVCIPYDENDPKPGNGTMLAFPADTREDVDKLYASAIALGATDAGAPGERMPTFYGGYFRDLDGNKAVFCKMG